MLHVDLRGRPIIIVTALLIVQWNACGCVSLIRCCIINCIGTLAYRSIQGGVHELLKATTPNTTFSLDNYSGPCSSVIQVNRLVVHCLMKRETHALV